MKGGKMVGNHRFAALICFPYSESTAARKGAKCLGVLPGYFKMEVYGSFYK